MAGSVEYKVLVRHTVDLQQAVKDNLTALGAQLVAAEIITPGQYREIRNPNRPVNERGADLVEYVQNKVRQDPRHYQAFLGALWSDLSQYGGILAKLKQASLSQVSEQQPLIPQSPLSREDDDQLPPQGEAMTTYNENKIKGLFSTLLLDVRKTLEAHSIDIKDVRQFLGSFFRTDDCFREAACVEQIFTAVSINHLWDHENYGPVEALAKGLLPKDAVERRMRDYKSNLSGYFTAITVLEYMEKRNLQPDDFEEEPSPLRKLTLKQYRKIKVILQLERKVSELSLAYIHGLWVSFAEEYELPSLTAIIDEIVEGSLTIAWLVLGHVASMIKPKSRFFRRHQIILVFIDDVILYDEKTMPGYEEQLLLLCAEGKADISQFSDILNHGVDPDIHDQYGKHPLWYAVYHRRADLVHLLLENKANVDLITIDGDFAESALTRAYTCINSYEEIANTLVKNSVDMKKIVDGFKILRKHFNELVDAITDRDMLAEEAFIRAKRPLEKLAEEAAENSKRPRLEEHGETSDVDSHPANVAIDSNSVICKKRSLEKLAEEPAEKRPRLEGEYSKISIVDSHSANVAIDNNPLLKHRPKLSAFYSHQPEVPEGTWPPVKKTQYINLALIKTEKQADFSKELLRQTIRGSIDDIMKDKDDIKYDEVFAKVEEGARLLFEGRSGCGKTTMMNKVSQDWAKWKIFSSCLLFLVHLQRFGNRSDINLETVLCSTPVEFSDEEFRELVAQIESNQGKGIVFVLDGLDEYCPEKKYKKTTFIHKLIKGEVLPKSIVIVASRPAASQKYRRNATKCIEVLGFLKEQIFEYVDSYFDGNKDKHSLLGLRTYLEHHPNIMHMCYLPLHMAMVTYLYEIEGASLPQTETEIYHHFTLLTLLRSIRKRNDTEMEIDDEEEFCFSSFDDLQPEDRSIFDCILKFAYEVTVVNPQQMFSAEEVRKFISRRISDDLLGLLVVDKYFAKYGLKEIYTFLHLTFQEFLSACHIVQLDSQAQEEIILKYGSDRSLGVVWKFYCGMTQFSDEKMHYFEHFVETTKSEVLLHLRCAHESQQNILCTHIINSYDSKIVLNSLSLNPADFTALGYVLTHSSVPATELAITSCNIGPEGLSALEKAVNVSTPPTLKTLSFHGTKVKKVIPELCSVLTKFRELHNLIFSSCGIIKGSLSEMVEMLPTLESVERLDLSWNKIKDACAQALVKGLQHCTHLQKLNLSWNKIEDAGAQALAVGLQYYTNLQRLNLNGNNIGAVGAQALVEGLQHCTTLQELNLSWNKIEDAGAQALAEGLQHYTNLQVLERNIESAHGREVERQDYSQEDKEMTEKCLEAKGVFSWKSADSLAQEPEEKPQLPSACVWKLPGVEECDETCVVVHSSQGQHVEWNGLKLHIHAGSLPEGLQQCTIFIKASLDGEYEIPENTSLVSAIFWLRCEPQCIFTKPVTVEIQHCSTKQDLSKLEIVRAFCSQKSLPYKFKPLGGRFDADTFYGTIDMKGFSGVGVVDKNPNLERMYYRQLFYRNHQQKHEIHIIFVWNIELHLNHIRQNFPEDKFIAGYHRVVEIEGKEIKVVLDEAKWTRVTDGQWEILPAEPIVTKAALDDFKPGRGLPSCVLEARPLSEDLPQLVHQIILKGIKPPDHKTLLSYLPPKINQDDVKRTRVFLYPAGRVQLKHLKLIKWTDGRGEIHRFYLMEHISSKWRDFGELIGLSGPMLTSIATEHHKEPLECCRAVLSHWLENPPAEYPLTWKKLIELLTDCKLGQVVSELQRVLSKTNFE